MEPTLVESSSLNFGALTSQVPTENNNIIIAQKAFLTASSCVIVSSPLRINTEKENILHET